MSYQKLCFGFQIWVYGKFTFEGLHIIIIQIFKFQKLFIKVDNGSNIGTTLVKWFDLEKYQLE
jgi:hypothetical protein